MAGVKPGHGIKGVLCGERLWVAGLCLDWSTRRARTLLPRKAQNQDDRAHLELEELSVKTFQKNVV
jgi:hypothetical protein